MLIVPVCDEPGSHKPRQTHFGLDKSNLIFERRSEILVDVLLVVKTRHLLFYEINLFIVGKLKILFSSSCRACIACLRSSIPFSRA